MTSKTFSAQRYLTAFRHAASIEKRDSVHVYIPEHLSTMLAMAKIVRHLNDKISHDITVDVLGDLSQYPAIHIMNTTTLSGLFITIKPWEKENIVVLEIENKGGI